MIYIFLNHFFIKVHHQIKKAAYDKEFSKSYTKRTILQEGLSNKNYAAKIVIHNL